MKRKLLIIYLLLFVVIVASLALILTHLPQTGDEGDFSPPPFASAVVEGLPPEGLAGYSLLEITEDYQLGLCGELSLQDGQVDLWLTSPASNQVWIKARFLDEQGSLLGESGLIKPGYYLQSVPLNADLRPGQKVTIKIMAYEADTYFSAGTFAVQTVLR